MKLLSPLAIGFAFIATASQAQAENRSVLVVVSHDKDGKAKVSVHSDDKVDRREAVTMDEAYKAIAGMKGWGSTVSVFLVTDRVLARKDRKTLFDTIDANHWLDLSYYGREAPKNLADHFIKPKIEETGHWQPAEVVSFADFDDMKVKIDGKPHKAFLVGLSPLGNDGKARLEKLRKVAMAKFQKNALSARIVTRRDDAIGLSVDTFMHHKNDFGHTWDPGAYPYCWSGWGAYNFNAWFLHAGMTTPQDNFGGNERYREQFADIVKNIDLAAMAKLQTTTLMPTEFRMAGPFAGKDMLTVLARECGPENGPFDPKQVFQGAEPGDKIERPVIWGKIRADAKGYFDLAALLGKDGKNAASYMYAEFDSPTEHYAEISLGIDDGAKLWVNGKEVFKAEKTRAPAPGQDKVAIKLKKGTNAMLLKVANGDSVHGFHFTLRSKEEILRVAGGKLGPSMSGESSSNGPSS